MDNEIEAQELEWNEGTPTVVGRELLKLGAGDVADLRAAEEADAVSLPVGTKFRYTTASSFSFLHIDGRWVRTF